MKTQHPHQKYFTIALIGLFTMFLSSIASSYPNRVPGGLNHGSSSAFLLEQAYAKLDAADHDYNGHRVHAMQLIKRATYIVGGSINPDTKATAEGHEPQAISDELLTAARVQLTNARVQLQRLPLKLVDEAIGEIDTALSIK